MKLFFRIEPPYQWVKYEGGKVDAFGEVETLEDLPTGSEIDEHIGVINSENVSIHQVAVPARNRKQMMTAVPYALEESLTDDIDDLHFVLLDWQAGESATVAVISRDKMQACLDAVKQYGLNLDRLLPDMMLLPLHAAAEHTIVLTDYSAEPRLLIRSRQQPPVCLDLDLLPYWIQAAAAPPSTEDGEEASVADSALVGLGGLGINSEDLARQLLEEDDSLDVRHWAIGGRMAYWLEHNPDFSANLLSGDFQPIQSNAGKNSWRWAASFVIAAVVLKLVFDGYEFFTLWQENKRIDREVQAIVKQTFPDLNNIIVGQERLIMQRQIERLKGNTSGLGEFQDILSVIAEVSSGNPFQISDLRFRSGELTMTCLLRDFSQVDSLTTRLNQHQRVDAELTSSGSEGNQVSARYVVRRKA